ncbi:RNA methyltransferase [Scytonema hofmannii PCC 7110]|uniref:RNA methyltransferase n=1 Tax=Scytonema hofmannii PCC 7110 TaxID=128403 RepID=A0A139WT14_9CYAN|nr:class I SAM-dependent methyltransferase [Scytonema hofmannii]KYC35547.1 RNA methyltransferase [Scytonema hofmannii PCC 7110]
MLKILIAIVSVTSLILMGCTQQRNFEIEAQIPASVVQPQQREADVPYVSTPEEVVNQMLKMANVSSKDVLYDLGSGDGRIPITAVQNYGVSRAIGVEINPQLVQQSRENAQKQGVSERVTFLQQDLFQTNLSDATVVTLYLLPRINRRLRPKLLKELKPGTRIVSHDFDMGNWKPDRVLQVKGPTRRHTIYYWVVPAKATINPLK